MKLSSLRSKLILAGALSGVVSGILPKLLIGPQEYSTIELYYFCGPGILYALMLGAVLLQSRRIGAGGALALLVTSVAGYFAAAEIAMWLVDPVIEVIGKIAGPMLTGMIAGAAGAILIAAALIAALRITPFGASLGKLVVGGALLGAFFILFNFDAPLLFQTAFFVVWQAGFAALVGTLEARAAAK